MDDEAVFGRCEWCEMPKPLFDCDEYGFLCLSCAGWLSDYMSDDKAIAPRVEAPVYMVIEREIEWPERTS